MPFFIAEADVVARYGQKEIIELTDRNPVQTNAIDTTILNAKIDDAEAELLGYVQCCFDIAGIKALYDAAKNIPAFTTWLCKITRKNLYDSIRLNINSGEIDHQAMREYKEVIKQLKELCDCGTLLDNNYEVIEKRNINSLVTDPSCVEYQCKCPEDEERGLTSET